MKSLNNKVDDYSIAREYYIDIYNLLGYLEEDWDNSSNFVGSTVVRIRESIWGQINNEEL